MQRVLVPLLCLLAYLALGFWLHEDYGLSWDELYETRYGRVVYEYVTGQNDRLLSAEYEAQSVYGAVIPLFQYAVGQWYQPKSERDLFFLQHWLLFLVSSIGIGAFYGLCLERFRNAGIALLGSLCLILSPRLFADSFFNPKDIPFMAFFALGMFTGLRWIRTLRVGALLAHALACALVIDIRVIGIFVPTLTVLVGLGHHFLETPRDRKLRFSRQSLFLVFLTLCGTVAFWPTSWHDPWSEFLRAVAAMSHYPWGGETLYRGQFVGSTDLPWHYLFVWIGITTPVLYLIGSGIGLATTMMRLVRGPLAVLKSNPADLLVLTWLVIPLAAIIGRDAVLYDGWRHAFFVYPALLYFAVLGGVRSCGWLRNALRAGGASRRAHKAIIGLAGAALALSLGWIGFQVIRYHPFQNVYFNALAGDPATLRGRFELDYWGTSYRLGLEYLARLEPGRTATVFVGSCPGRLNRFLLPPVDQQRLLITDNAAEAQYFLTNFRWHPEDYPFREVFSVTRGGIKILAGYDVGGQNASIALPRLAGC